MIQCNLYYPIIFYASVIVIFFPSYALAYVGPGTGLSAFGSLFALFAAIVFAIFGFVWFPIKRIIKRIQQKSLDNKYKQ